MTKLPLSFFEGTDVVEMARLLIGKILVTEFDGEVTSGRIVETEAYNGTIDRASHAYGGRRTRRTEIMYRRGGTAYVYLCYGIHHLFNIVTNVEDVPHAVLVRAVEPLGGIEQMRARVAQKSESGYADHYRLGRGPGLVSKSMGISTAHTGILLQETISIYDDPAWKLTPSEILAGPRIGVDYAGEDASLPYRFWVKGNRSVSKLEFRAGNVLPAF